MEQRVLTGDSDTEREVAHQRFERVKELHRMGLNIIPLGHREKIPKVCWKKYQSIRIPEEILPAWFDLCNWGNWAVLHGPVSGTVCVEADNAEARKLLLEKCPPSPVRLLSSRGEHFIYRHPGPGIKAKCHQFPKEHKLHGIDVKGDGGYSVAPLSVHKSGAVYAEVEPWTAELLDSAPVYDPAWLGLDKLPERERPEVEYDLDELSDHPAPFDVRVQLAEQWLAKQPGAQQGRGKGADAYCMAIAIKLVKGFLLPEDAAVDLLFDWGQRDDQLAADGTVWTWKAGEIMHKIAGAREATYKRPGDMLKHWAASVEDRLDEIIQYKPVEVASKKKVVEPDQQRLCTLDELFSLTDDRFEWIIERRLPKGKLHILSGPSKDGKTTALYHCAVEAVYNGMALGQTADPCKILSLDYENDTGYLKEFILEPAMRGRDWGRLKEFLHVSNKQVRHDKLKLPPYVNAAYLDQLINAYGGPVWIIIDSLRRAFGRTPDLPPKWEDSHDAIDKVLGPIATYCHQYGPTVSVIHHFNKSGSISGSTDILGVADLAWNFTRIRDAAGQRTKEAKIIMEGRGIPEEPLFLEMVDDRYQFQGEGEDYKQQRNFANTLLVVESVVKLLEKGPMGGPEIIKKLGIRNKNDFHSVTPAMREHGVVVLEEKKWRLVENYNHGLMAYKLRNGYL